MRRSIATAATIDADIADVRSELQRERLDRAQLSEVEDRLSRIADALENALKDVEGTDGHTPDVVLADLALQNVRDTLGWARLYRKHASYAERRARIGEALWSAAGAWERLRHSVRPAGQGSRAGMA